MIKDHAESMACDQDMMDTFMDRIEFDAYQMLSNVAAHHKVQTAHTLRVQAEQEQDTIEVGELAEFLMRFVATIMHEVHALSPENDAVSDAMAQDIVALSCVDAAMLARVQHLTRTKALFVATDRDKSGSVSRTELFQALRRFKVSVTKKEYREVFRVIDPDQTHSMSMDEWIDFMTATDDGLDSRSAVRVAKEASIITEDTELGTTLSPGGSAKKSAVWPEEAAGLLGALPAPP